MHNIDRTQLEWEGETYEAESYPEVYGEYGAYGEYGEHEEFYGEAEAETALNESEEAEFALELLGITSEEELDQFLGKLFRKIGRGIGKFVRGPVGRTLGGILKGVAKKALPIVGGALGSFVAPGIGTAIGSSLGSAAGRMFGLEMEGMTPEDQEWEVARRYVRFASEAVRQAAKMPPNIHPQQAAQSALSIAAQKYAPGLAGGMAAPAPPAAAMRPGMKQSGRWFRRGRQIIITL